MFRPFGSAANTSSNNTGTVTPFGTPQAAQNTSSFNFNTPGGFGSSAPPQQPAFGATFGGQAPPSGPFGSTGIINTSLGNNPRYTTTNDVENNVTITIHAINAMPAYQKSSLEELRLEDYLAGRKGATSAFGAVGSAVPQQGLFGTAPAAPASGSLFGSAGGLFGTTPAPQQQQQQQPISAFGQSTGIFGQPQQQPQPGAFSSFGQPSSTSTGLFGQPAAPSVSTFGQAPAAAQSTFSAFNKPATSTFGLARPTSTPSGGLFGQAPTQTSTFGAQTGGDLFGASAVAKPAAPSFSFGGTQQQAQPSAGLFGQQIAATSAPTTFQFGASAQPQPQAQAPPSFNFGGLTQQPQQQQGSLFSTAPTPSAGGFSFGASGATTSQPAPTIPSFGTQPQTTQPSSFAFNLGGATGATSAAPSMAGQTNFTGGSSNLFSLPQQQPAQQQQQTFSLAPQQQQQPASTFSFSMPNATGTGTTSSLTLPLVSADALSMRPPIPAVLSTPKETPSSTVKSIPSSSSRSTAHFTPRASFRLQPPTESSSFSSTSLITGTGFVLPKRVSSKKLVISPSDAVPGARFQRSNSHNLSRVDSFTLSNAGDVYETSSVIAGDLAYGEKYMLPSENTLRKLPYTQLCAIQNFTIGERGVGQVRFLQPVDLTKINLNDIFERIVVFEPRLVTLYPDDEFSSEEKPLIGTGLNLPAEVRLEKCWPLSKADRQPIKDMSDPRLQVHIERLKNQENTKFVDYIPDSGTWVFRVDNFDSTSE